MFQTAPVQYVIAQYELLLLTAAEIAQNVAMTEFDVQCIIDEHNSAIDEFILKNEPFDAGCEFDPVLH